MPCCSKTNAHPRRTDPGHPRPAHPLVIPALHRLERQGCLASEWKRSEANRRARYYKLTPKGRRQLSAEQSRWKQLVRAVARTMKPVKE
ncbi:MAG: helix-turn-helix transcriptional regulator [Bryobacteraceae bacterium]